MAVNAGFVVEMSLFCVYSVAMAFMEETPTNLKPSLLRVYELESKSVLLGITKSVVGMSMFLRGATLYFYLGTLACMFIPVVTGSHPYFYVPWLLVALFRCVIFNLFLLLSGFCVCIIFSPIKPACMEFIFIKMLESVIYTYYWIKINRAYVELCRQTGVKYVPFLRHFQSKAEFRCQEVAYRRRRLRTLGNRPLPPRTRPPFHSTSADDLCYSSDSDYSFSTQMDSDTTKGSRSLDSLFTNATMDWFIKEALVHQSVEKDDARYEEGLAKRATTFLQGTLGRKHRSARNDEFEVITNLLPLHTTQRYDPDEEASAVAVKESRVAESKEMCSRFSGTTCAEGETSCTTEMKSLRSGRDDASSEVENQHPEKNKDSRIETEHEWYKDELEMRPEGKAIEMEVMRPALGADNVLGLAYTLRSGADDSDESQRSNDESSTRSGNYFGSQGCLDQSVPSEIETEEEKMADEEYEESHECIEKICSGRLVGGKSITDESNCDQSQVPRARRTEEMSVSQCDATPDGVRTEDQWPRADREPLDNLLLPNGTEIVVSATVMVLCDGLKDADSSSIGSFSGTGLQSKSCTSSVSPDVLTLDRIVAALYESSHVKEYMDTVNIPKEQQAVLLEEGGLNRNNEFLAESPEGKTVPGEDDSVGRSVPSTDKSSHNEDTVCHKCDQWIQRTSEQTLSEIEEDETAEDVPCNDISHNESPAIKQEGSVQDASSSNDATHDEHDAASVMKQEEALKDVSSSNDESHDELLAVKKEEVPVVVSSSDCESHDELPAVKQEEIVEDVLSSDCKVHFEIPAAKQEEVATDELSSDYKSHDEAPAVKQEEVVEDVSSSDCKSHDEAPAVKQEEVVEDVSSIDCKSHDEAPAVKQEEVVEDVSSFDCKSHDEAPAVKQEDIVEDVSSFDCKSHDEVPAVRQEEVVEDVSSFDCKSHDEALAVKQEEVVEDISSSDCKSHDEVPAVRQEEVVEDTSSSNYESLDEEPGVKQERVVKDVSSSDDSSHERSPVVTTNETIEDRLTDNTSHDESSTEEKKCVEKRQSKFEQNVLVEGLMLETIMWRGDASSFDIAASSGSSVCSQAMTQTMGRNSHPGDQLVTLDSSDSCDSTEHQISVIDLTKCSGGGSNSHMGISDRVRKFLANSKNPERNNRCDNASISDSIISAKETSRGHSPSLNRTCTIRNVAGGLMMSDTCEYRSNYDNQDSVFLSTGSQATFMADRSYDHSLDESEYASIVSGECSICLSRFSPENMSTADELTIDGTFESDINTVFNENNSLGSASHRTVSVCSGSSADETSTISGDQTASVKKSVTVCKIDIVDDKAIHKPSGIAVNINKDLFPDSMLVSTEQIKETTVLVCSAGSNSRVDQSPPDSSMENNVNVDKPEQENSTLQTELINYISVTKEILREFNDAASMERTLDSAIKRRIAEVEDSATSETTLCSVSKSHALFDSGPSVAGKNQPCTNENVLDCTTSILEAYDVPELIPEARNLTKSNSKGNVNQPNYFPTLIPGASSSKRTQNDDCSIAPQVFTEVRSNNRSTENCPCKRDSVDKLSEFQCSNSDDSTINSASDMVPQKSGETNIHPVNTIDRKFSDSNCLHDEKVAEPRGVKDILKQFNAVSSAKSGAADTKAKKPHLDENRDESSNDLREVSPLNEDTMSNEVCRPPSGIPEKARGELREVQSNISGTHDSASERNSSETISGLQDLNNDANAIHSAGTLLLEKTSVTNTAMIIVGNTLDGKISQTHFRPDENDSQCKANTLSESIKIVTVATESKSSLILKPEVCSVHSISRPGENTLFDSDSGIETPKTSQGNLSNNSETVVIKTSQVEINAKSSIFKKLIDKFSASTSCVKNLNDVPAYDRTKFESLPDRAQFPPESSMSDMESVEEICFQAKISVEEQHLSVKSLSALSGGPSPDEGLQPNKVPSMDGFTHENQECPNVNVNEGKAAKESLSTNKASSISTTNKTAFVNEVGPRVNEVHFLKDEESHGHSAEEATAENRPKPATESRTHSKSAERASSEEPEISQFISLHGSESNSRLSMDDDRKVCEETKVSFHGSLTDRVASHKGPQVNSTSYCDKPPSKCAVNVKKGDSKTDTHIIDSSSIETVISGGQLMEAYSAAIIISKSVEKITLSNNSPPETMLRTPLRARPGKLSQDVEKGDKEECSSRDSSNAMVKESTSLSTNEEPSISTTECVTPEYQDCPDIKCVTPEYQDCPDINVKEGKPSEQCLSPNKAPSISSADATTCVNEVDPRVNDVHILKDEESRRQSDDEAIGKNRSYSAIVSRAHSKSTERGLNDETEDHKFISLHSSGSQSRHSMDLATKPRKIITKIPSPLTLRDRSKSAERVSNDEIEEHKFISKSAERVSNDEIEEHKFISSHSSASHSRQSIHDDRSASQSTTMALHGSLNDRLLAEKMSQANSTSDTDRLPCKSAETSEKEDLGTDTDTVASLTTETDVNTKLVRETCSTTIIISQSSEKIAFSNDSPSESTPPTPRPSCHGKLSQDQEKSDKEECSSRENAPAMVKKSRVNFVLSFENKPEVQPPAAATSGVFQRLMAKFSTPGEAPPTVKDNLRKFSAMSPGKPSISDIQSKKNQWDESKDQSSNHSQGSILLNKDTPSSDKTRIPCRIPDRAAEPPILKDNLKKFNAVSTCRSSVSGDQSKKHHSDDSNDQSSNDSHGGSSLCEDTPPDDKTRTPCKISGRATEAPSVKDNLKKFNAMSTGTSSVSGFQSRKNHFDENKDQSSNTSLGSNLLRKDSIPNDTSRRVGKISEKAALFNKPTIESSSSGKICSLSPRASRNSDFSKIGNNSVLNSIKSLEKSSAIGKVAIAEKTSPENFPSSEVFKSVRTKFSSLPVGTLRPKPAGTLSETKSISRVNYNAKEKITDSKCKLPVSSSKLSANVLEAKESISQRSRPAKFDSTSSKTHRETGKIHSNSSVTSNCRETGNREDKSDVETISRSCSREIRKDGCNTGSNKCEEDSRSETGDSGCNQ